MASKSSPRDLMNSPIFTCQLNISKDWLFTRLTGAVSDEMDVRVLSKLLLPSVDNELWNEFVSYIDSDKSW